MQPLYEQLTQALPFFLIAGPCVVESEAVMFNTAEHLKKLCQRKNIPLVFKASYRKANRSSANSPTGPGMDAGLTLLARLKQEFNLPVLSDVHECAELTAAAEVCDILQIPAFLSRQTELIAGAAQTGRIVNIKKGQFMAPEDMLAAANKATTMGNEKVLLTERGSSFGYHNLVVDFRGFAIMEAFGFPVVYDVTHSLQRPSQAVSNLGNQEIANPGSNPVSGGNPEFAAMMARAAIATGKVKGLFIETHPEPHKALSDAASMLPLRQMEALLEGCINIAQALQDTHNG